LKTTAYRRRIEVEAKKDMLVKEEKREEENYSLFSMNQLLCEEPDMLPKTK
jgi:hypothetical protein